MTARPRHSASGVPLLRPDGADAIADSSTLLVRDGAL